MNSSAPSPQNQPIPVVSIQSPPPRITSDFWPELKEALLIGPEKFGHLALQCCYCLESMTVSGQEHIRDPQVYNLTHGAHILPCGHIFGEKCITQMWEYSFNEHGWFACPICRRYMDFHRHCCHDINSLPMPETLEEIQTFPPTLGEVDKILVTDKCGDCMILDEVVNLSSMAQNHLPPKLVLYEGEYLAVSAMGSFKMWAPPTWPDSGDTIVATLSPVGVLAELCELSRKSLAENSQGKWWSVNFRDLEYRLHIVRVW
ncbi:hypothetical protein ACHAPT_007566 [Fusarium lateritium]